MAYGSDFALAGNTILADPSASTTDIPLTAGYVTADTATVRGVNAAATFTMSCQ